MMSAGNFPVQLCVIRHVIKASVWPTTHVGVGMVTMETPAPKSLVSEPARTSKHV